MDTFSLYVISILNVLITGIVITFIVSAGDEKSGFRSIGIGCLLVGAGLAAIVLRVVLPGKAVIAVSNVIFLFSAYYLVTGIRSFCGIQQISKAVLTGCLTFIGAVIFYFLFADPNTLARVAISSALFALVSFHNGASIVKSAKSRDRQVEWFTAGAFFIIGASHFVRMMWAFVGNLPLGRLIGDGPVEIANLVALNLSISVCGFGLVTIRNFRLNRHAEELALYDPLTQLPNRRFFEERLSLAGRRASRTKGRLALIYVDIDGFKPINDSLGHEAGDEVLRTIAQRLSQHVRESDCVARMGGDEFVLLLEDAPARRELDELMERLKSNAGYRVEVAHHSVHVVISCGLAVFPDDVTEVNRLVGDADRAMYAAKWSARCTQV